MPSGRLSLLCHYIYWEVHNFSYAHSIMSYGIIFWGNSSHSEEIFKVQKRIIRIIMNLSKYTSCRQPFKELNILPVPSQYIISVLLFLIKNKDQFMTDSQIHKITTRQTSDLYVPAANLTVYQKGVLLPGNQDLQPFTKNY